jgi:Zn-dependent protease with chaperone function
LNSDLSGGVWRFRTVKSLLLLSALLISSTSAAQCDWLAKFQTAIQRRYQTKENACKALKAPPEEFNAAHAMIENQLLSQYRMISSPREEAWLDTVSQHLMAQLGANQGQQIHIAAIAVPNAFATGNNVTFHSGLVEWYLDPVSALTKIGVSPDEARTYLQSLEIEPAGQEGLIAVLAHETAHNILGHPDVRPLVLACEDYMAAGVREVHNYEQLVSTGKKGSRWGAFFRSSAFIGSEMMFGSQRQQQLESDADALGAWLAYKETNDPYAMAKGLEWLAAFPGAGEPGGWSEIMCSDHPQLMARVSAMQTAALSLANGPPRQLLNLPQNQTKKDYDDFLKWYPARIDKIERIVAGNLLPQERASRREIEIELKPSGAIGSLDGNPLTGQKQKLALPLGPHVLKAQVGSIMKQYEFVVLDEGPSKFKWEVK